MSIEQRLSLVEAAMARLQERLGLAPVRPDWVDRMSGSLADLPEDDYQQFLDCCRAVRNQGDLPVGEESR